MKNYGALTQVLYKALCDFDNSVLVFGFGLALLADEVMDNLPHEYVGFQTIMPNCIC